MTWKDRLPGGLSDAKKPTDFSTAALAKGRAVEKEHTSSRHLQTEIAMDHLTEDPSYYKKLQKMEKVSFSTSAYSGPLNPVIASGASYLPPRRAPQLKSAIQKTAELWPGFASEMRKFAASTALVRTGVPGSRGPSQQGVNVGMWWEQVGAPYLKDGGKHKTLKKMMQKDGIPENFQKRFMGVAKETYPEKASKLESLWESVKNRGPKEWKPEASSWTGPGPEPANPNYKGDPRAWDDPMGRRYRQQQEAAEAQAKQVHKDYVNPASAAGAAALAGTSLYGALASHHEDPRTPTSAGMGRLGSYLQTGGALGQVGYGLGTLTNQRGAGLIGAGIGALSGIPIGELVHQSHETSAKREGKRVARDASPGAEKALTRRAGMTTAAHMNKATPQVLSSALFNSFIGGGSGQNAGIPLLLGAAEHVGTGLSGKRRAGAALEHFDKAAASAPTRGNFMMASDIPPFKQPRLDRAIQKDGALEAKEAGVRAFARGAYSAATRPLREAERVIDQFDQGHVRDRALGEMAGAAGIGAGVYHLGKRSGKKAQKTKKTKEGDMLSDYVTYNQGDFKPVNLNKKTASKYAMSMAEMSAFVNELLEKDASPSSQLRQSQAVGAPRATPPPGPSIKSIAKATGPGTGSGMAGAFKGPIGMTAPVGLK